MNSLSMQATAIIALLAANAFFVAAEFALVSARSFRIEPKARAGQRSAQLTLHIKENIDPYLSACQLGITMASLGLGWLGEPAVAALLGPLLLPFGLPDATLHTISFLTGFIIFSSLHIVVGEQVPKTLAIRKAETISLLIAYPLRGFFLIIYPLNWLLNAASTGILRMFNVREASHAEVLTSDELRGLIRTSAKHGEVAAERATMLHNLFRFDVRPISRVMIPRSETQILRLDLPAAENLQIIRASHYSRFPVVDGGLDNLVGVLLVRDLADAMIDGTPAPWEDLTPFCRDPLVVPESIRVAELFEMMREMRVHMACVVDEYGSFAGVITLEDLLEEIVGEIADETDKQEQDFPVIQNDGHWNAHGLTSLADLERVTGFQSDKQLSANTISGLLMSELERMPVEDDVIICDDFRFTVLAMKKHRVESVRIDNLTDDEETTNEKAGGESAAQNGDA